MANDCNYVLYIIYSVKESQYVLLKKLKMTKVFKVLKLLVKWMRLGMYEFSSLPFATKVEMQEGDRTRLRSIRQIHEGTHIMFITL